MKRIVIDTLGNQIIDKNPDGSDVRRVTNSSSGITAISAVWRP